MTYDIGDIVTYLSRYYQRPLRVRVMAKITTPDGQPGFDAVIINDQGEPDIEHYFFTEVWSNDSQLLTVERAS